jgi:hypothetical protein
MVTSDRRWPPELEGRNVKYVVLMCADPAQTKAMTAQDRDTVARKHAALRTELINSGELLDGAGLAYPADTTTLRLEDGTVAITEGPLRASTPHLTAYYLVTCPDMPRARAIATRILDSHVPR